MSKHTKNKNNKKHNHYDSAINPNAELVITPRKLARNVARNMRAADGEKRVNRGISTGWRKTVAPIARRRPLNSLVSSANKKLIGLDGPSPSSQLAHHLPLKP